MTRQYTEHVISLTPSSRIKNIRQKLLCILLYVIPQITIIIMIIFMYNIFRVFELISSQ
jgi:hypothetical protein